MRLFVLLLTHVTLGKILLRVCSAGLQWALLAVWELASGGEDGGRCGGCGKKPAKESFLIWKDRNPSGAAQG